MYFEEQPWLLVPLIILVVEGWALTKHLARKWFAQRPHLMINRRAMHEASTHRPSAREVRF